MENRPILTVGQDLPVSIDPRVEENLQKNGIQFLPVTVPVDLPVSANLALELANKIVVPQLVQQPIKTTVEFVAFSQSRQGYQNKNVWKITYWGASRKFHAPPKIDGSNLTIEQPTSRRAVTWILIDPMNASEDFIMIHSAGLIHD